MPIRPFPEKTGFLSKEFFGGPNLSTPIGYLVAHIDGGARGNPGPAGYGVVIEDEMGRPVAELSQYLGKQTNNYAEYSGLLAALNYATKHGFKALKVFSDSELMVKQILGRYKVNHPMLKELHAKATRMIDDLEAFEITHVLREKNREADRLANRAMDLGMKILTDDATRTGAAVATLREVSGIVRNGVVVFLGPQLPEGTQVTVRVTKPATN
jgi:ribonuclease HI